jgi:hypothetical protein
MDRPTRQEQARAILNRRGHRLAAEILQRRPASAADYEEAFNLERIDLIAEISGPEALLALGRNRVGPRDGLYILDDGGSYRVYVQERGIEMGAVAGVGFEEARDAVIDRIIMLQGLPFRPPG